MFEWLKNYLLQQEIKENSGVKKQFTEWNKVQSVAVVTGSGHYSIVKEFVKQAGKNFDIMVVHNDKVTRTKDS